jgi:toxin FitB
MGCADAGEGHRNERHRAGGDTAWDRAEAPTDPAQGEALQLWFGQMRARLGDRVLPIDEPVAEAWALLGVPDPMPLIDGLLAATAKVHGLTLVTRNVADFVRAGVSAVDPFSA